MSQDKMPVIFLMGPTAAGKTALACELAQIFPLDIISVDSAMIYRGMDIGTAKPTPDVLQAFPHALVDICDPSESYSAAQFREDALQHIHAIQKKKRIPFLVGGTQLYFYVLERGIAPLPHADPEIRERLQQEAQKLGWEMLHERLQRVDPLAAGRIHPHDKQRLQRALEVYELTGRCLTEWHAEATTKALDFSIIHLALVPGARGWLHERIAARFQHMLSHGFIEEVEVLKRRGDLDLSKPSMRAVGYRQVWEYLEGKMDQETLRERGIVATRQFAKRQLTWLRQWEASTTLFDASASQVGQKMVEFLRERIG